jgi:ubiquinol-cytochrome c reductase cytochrome c1 subunit
MTFRVFSPKLSAALLAGVVLTALPLCNAAQADAAATTAPADASAPAAAAESGAGQPQDANNHSGEAELVKQHWSFDGVFGTYDRAALQRGYQVYKQVCSACHSMNRLYYRDLEEIGFTEGQVKTIAAEYTVTDGPNDQGEMFERPARPSDHFKAPFPNRKASMAANNGAYPPDMSLLAKARHGGADYIYGILTGYADPPPGTPKLLDTQHWNKTIPGHIIAMPQPINDGQVTYDDGTKGTLDQYARDVAQFLTWASEPHMEDRKRIGIKAFIFMLVFSFVMYNVKKKVWENVEH